MAIERCQEICVQWCYMNEHNEFLIKKCNVPVYLILSSYRFGHCYAADVLLTLYFKSYIQRLMSK